MANEEKNTRRLKVTITCDPRLSDSITDYLIGVWNCGVEMGLEDHPAKQSLHAFFDSEAPDPDEIETLVARIRTYCRELSAIFQVEEVLVVPETIEDEDWSNSWKQHFRPFAIVPGLVIKPTWEDYSPAGDELVIEMDPGMAFGTGHHATTSLCMDFIRTAVQAGNGEAVLDIGTGTGILAMAAALFGADRVMAIDNDPEAVSAAQLNAVQNGLGDKIDVDIRPLESLQGEYSLVVANIIHDVLVAMEPDIRRLTKKGGTVVLSGILREGQADSIISLYRKTGFALVERREKDEWAALLLTRG